jgi:hypothetical protein
MVWETRVADVSRVQLIASVARGGGADRVTTFAYEPVAGLSDTITDPELRVVAGSQRGEVPVVVAGVERQGVGALS